MKKHIFSLLFLVTGILISLAWLLLYVASANLDVHDTYFVLSPYVPVGGALLLYLFFAGIYFALTVKKRAILKIPAYIHYLLTTLLFLTLTVSPLLFTGGSPPNITRGTAGILYVLNLLTGISALLFICGQFLFLFIVIYALRRKDPSS
ncbi:MAG TPA: hypothetical protein VFU15_07680 [Bacteroidia bacterium]|nr:hypothetical protein [Bacteroidia bacterium]